MDDFSLITSAQEFDSYVSEVYSENRPEILLNGHVYSQYLELNCNVRAVANAMCKLHNSMQDTSLMKKCEFKLRDLLKKSQSWTQASQYWEERTSGHVWNTPEDIWCQFSCQTRYSNETIYSTAHTSNDMFNTITSISEEAIGRRTYFISETLKNWLWKMSTITTCSLTQKHFIQKG